MKKFFLVLHQKKKSKQIDKKKIFLTIEILGVFFSPFLNFLGPGQKKDGLFKKRKIIFWHGIKNVLSGGYYGEALPPRAGKKNFLKKNFINTLRNFLKKPKKFEKNEEQTPERGRKKKDVGGEPPTFAEPFLKGPFFPPLLGKPFSGWGGVPPPWGVAKRGIFPPRLWGLSFDPHAGQVFFLSFSMPPPL